MRGGMATDGLPAGKNWHNRRKNHLQAAAYAPLHWGLGREVGRVGLIGERLSAAEDDGGGVEIHRTVEEKALGVDLHACRTSHEEEIRFWE
jgi:hypothetical protein